ncbi:tetratricopeptide repeat-containing glycosyltransferase family 2 protein [Cohnella terricola]|uniref:Glycosyltransferase n=1 Tax=Cohnella terricola TaxID=1289167 RepID=A0A559J882_9BACL|nr:glycosyltransferase [Cohnella terricola]TVX96100.1 glycosyltransferase [Cohnella terricola]
MNLISLCMIVRDEEKLLSRCLESVQSLVDEIIIVDTGSVDRTKEIALRYTDRVYDFEWTNDFSAARNESIRYATGKWILVLDADEYVQKLDEHKLRHFLTDYHLSGPTGFILNIMNFTGSGFDETQMIKSTGVRLFSNSFGISYAQPIHEQLISNQDELRLVSLSLSVFHSGYTNDIVKEKNKSQRNRSILDHLSIDENPYHQFVLGNEQAAAGELAAALNNYRSAYENCSPDDTWYDHLLDRLIALELQTGQYHLAYSYILTGLRLKPDQTDYHCYYGKLLDALGFWNAAIEQFKTCIELADIAERKGLPYSIVHPSFGRIVPHQMLGNIYRKKGDMQSAIQHWAMALKMQPKNYEILQSLIDLLLIYDSGKQTEKVLEMLYPSSTPLNSVLLFKMLLKTGDAKSAHRYRLLAESEGIELTFADHVLIRLIDRLDLNAIEAKEEPLPPPLAVMSSIVSNEMRFVERLSMESRLLAQTAIQALREQPVDLSVIKDSYPTLDSVLILLWRFGYQDLYFQLVNQIADYDVLNRLASEFYRSGLVEEAIELYILLLEQGALCAEGLKTIGVWHINSLECSESLKFFEASLDDHSNIDTLGLVLENLNINEVSDFLNAYYERYPLLRDIDFTSIPNDQ